jgi:hypothetical protein
MKKTENKQEQVMLDIETMGTGSYSAILSIAAVKFNIETGKYTDEFYQRIDLQTCLDVGLKIKASTVYWWMGQGDEAREDFAKNISPLKDVLAYLSFFIDQDSLIWGNSNSFDCGILSNAYEKIGKPIPWNFWNERDVRTLLSLMPHIKNETDKVGISHNPIDDCKFQINYCTKIWNALKHD